MLRKHKHNIQPQNGAVSIDDLVCSRIGRNVLKEGRHAVDAAVASAFCIGVVLPASSGIGGGTFMLISLANGTSEAYDMREIAPAMASLVLNILASCGTLSAVNGAVGTYRTIEAIKNMFAVRTKLGDPKFVNVTNILSDMLSPKFAAELRKSINDNTTFEPEHYGDRWNLPDDHGTSHFCIADNDHNAVSITSTINSCFGSTILSHSTGIILNNEMDDFSIPTKIVANVPPPAPANYIQPFKQPFSSMTPTIVLKDGKLKFLVGASGGKKIVVSTVVLLDLLFKKMDPLLAVRAPRVYHQLISNVADYENWTAVLGDHIEVNDEILEGLKKRGHKMQVVGVGSNIQLITVDDVPSHENQQPIHRLTTVSTCSPLSFKSCDQGNICSTLINTVCNKVKTMFYLLSTVQKESSLEFFRRFRLAYSNAPDVSFTMIPLAVVSLLVECAGLNLLFLTKLSRYFQLALLLLPYC